MPSARRVAAGPNGGTQSSGLFSGQKNGSLIYHPEKSALCHVRHSKADSTDSLPYRNRLGPFVGWDQSQLAGRRPTRAEPSPAPCAANTCGASCGCDCAEGCCTCTGSREGPRGMKIQCRERPQVIEIRIDHRNRQQRQQQRQRLPAHRQHRDRPPLFRARTGGNKSGNSPATNEIVVIKIGRNRSRFACRIASSRFIPFAAARSYDRSARSTPSSPRRRAPGFPVPNTD